MAITMAHKPSKALQLIAYQSIIFSASAHYPLNAWRNYYDMHFRIMAASDPTIHWNVCHSDLWLKWITPFVRQPQSGRFPCSHCGSTSHYPENCNFCPSVVPNIPRKTTRKVSPATSGIPICIYFNTHNAYELCAGSYTNVNTVVQATQGKHAFHQDGECLPNKPLPWTPMQPFILEWELSNYPDKAFVEQLIHNLLHGYSIGQALNLLTQQKNLFT